MFHKPGKSVSCNSALYHVISVVTGRHFSYPCDMQANSNASKNFKRPLSANTIIKHVQEGGTEESADEQT
jgi:hypothetical protein